MLHEATAPNVEEGKESFLRWVAATYAPSTTEAYRRAVNNFLTHMRSAAGILPGSPIDRVTPVHLLTYLRALQSDYSPETEHLYSRAVGQFMQFLHRRGWGEDPTDALNTLEALRRPKDHTPPPSPTSYIRRIIDCAMAAAVPTSLDESAWRDDLRQMRDKAFLLLLADTGLKISQICDLRREAFRPEQAALTPTAEDLLHLSRPTSRALSHYLTQRSKLDEKQNRPISQLALFARHDKRASTRILPISRWTGNNIISAWAEAALTTQELAELKKSSIALSPQTFRHYFVYRTLQETDDIAAAQERARHADTTTTKRYLKRINAQKEQEPGS